MGGDTRGRSALDAGQKRLVEEHLWLADALAREMVWLAPKTIDGDVVQPAREGLIKAVRHFRPELGKPLTAYAPPWIKGAIFNAVDRRHPGFTKPHRVASDVLDAAEDEEEGSRRRGRRAPGSCRCGHVHLRHFIEMGLRATR